MTQKMTKEDKVWSDQNKQISDAGMDMSEKAATEALEYIERVTKNFGKTEHRKAALSNHALEVGIAMHLKTNIIGNLLPQMTLDIEQDLGKPQAMLITTLLFARYLRNVIEEVNNYEGK